MFSDFEDARGNKRPISVSQDLLVEILIQIDRFDVDGLRSILTMSRTAEPSLKAYLPRAMSKIGRYFRVACELINAARSPEYNLFRSISIQSIEKPHIDISFIADHPVGFDKAAQRVARSSHQHFLNAYGSGSISAARTKFESRMSNCPIPWKVHAEIQLLLFYEQQPHVPRPRIISSSKSACYLCDLFIHLHGEFCIPRTHGRLYDRWILPEEPLNDSAANRNLLPVIDKFNAALETKIVHTLRCRPRPFAHPNESVLILPQPWSSNSTLSEHCEHASIHETANSTCEMLSGDQTEPLSNTPPRSIPNPTRSDSPVVRHEPASIQETLAPSRETSSKNHTNPPSDPPLSTPTSPHQPTAQSPPSSPNPTNPLPHPASRILRLTPNAPTIHLLSHPQETLILETGPLSLHVSRDTNTLSDESSTVWVHIHSTTAGENKFDSSCEVVDVASLAEGCDVVVEGGAALSGKVLVFRFGGEVVVVWFSFESSGDM